MIVLKIVLLSVLVLGASILILSLFYLKFGFNKWLYHDIMGWHQPKDDAEITFDGCSSHCTCKHCGKEIMQDSQGNWFEY
jgi:hypothetical protein